MRKRNNKILRMVGIALMMALVFVMQSISSIIPPVGGFAISLVLIPIVLGSAVYGPGAGALLGATFGTIVYINCLTGADPGGAMVFQASPVLCFLVVMGKGTFAGLASGTVYKLLKGKNSYASLARGLTTPRYVFVSERTRPSFCQSFVICQAHRQIKI